MPRLLSLLFLTWFLAAPVSAAPSISVIDLGVGQDQVARAVVRLTLDNPGPASYQLALSSPPIGDDTPPPTGLILTAEAGAAPFDTPLTRNNPFTGSESTGIWIENEGIISRIFAAFEASTELASATYDLVELTYSGHTIITGSASIVQGSETWSLPIDDGVICDGSDACDCLGPGYNVNLQDLFNVQNNFGFSSPPSVGDMDCDSDIDLEDLFFVQNNFNLSLSTATALPEPNTIILLISAFAAAAPRPARTTTGLRRSTFSR